jgi:hypothetical protein
MSWPTDRDVEECCGIWFHRVIEKSFHVEPNDLEKFFNRFEFDSQFVGCEKVEPMPNIPDDPLFL